ncbi:MAG: TrmH family RNA methyltransferase [Gemmatimonadota bacterium]
MPESSGLSKRKESYLRGLARKSVRARRGRFVAEGPRVVEEALRGRLRVTELVATPSAAGDIDRWRAAGLLDHVEVSTADARAFRGLAEGVHPQGVLAVVEEPAERLEDLVPSGPVLVLDRLQDPGNAGTLVRSLQATGGSVVVALSGTVDLFNAKAVRASAGSLFHLRVASRVPAAALLEWLDAHGVPLHVLHPAGEPLFGPGWSAPGHVALAVGNEGGGADPALLRRAAWTLALPMSAGVESLNAGVAGSVALYELLRRRREGPAEAPALSREVEPS